MDVDDKQTVILIWLTGLCC